MVSIDLEPVHLLQRRLHVGEDRVRELEHLAAGLAGGVVVELVGEVVDRPAVAEVHVGDHADRLEGLERAVHRGEVDVGVAIVDRLGDLLGAHVSSALVEQHGEHGATGGGDPPTLLAEPLEDPVPAVIDRSWHGGRLPAGRAQALLRGTLLG